MTGNLLCIALIHRFCSLSNVLLLNTTFIKSCCWEEMIICIEPKELSGNKWLETTIPSILIFVLWDIFWLISTYANEIHPQELNAFPCASPILNIKEWQKRILWGKERSMDRRLDAKPEPTLSVVWKGCSECSIWENLDSSCELAMLA